MKAVIPVAGAGTLLRPHTHTQPKPLVPVAGEPILGHIIRQLIASGIQELVFVIGYLGEKIEAYVKAQYADHIRCTFVVQDPREGSAHAIWVAREHLREESEILIMLGDTIVEMDFSAFLLHPNTIVGVKKVDKPSLFGIAELGQDREVRRLVEKPLIPRSNLGLVGVYKIKNVPLLLDSIAELMEQNARTHGEYFLTDALMQMITKGEHIAWQKVNKWYDCSQKQDLLSANATLLRTLPPDLGAGSTIDQHSILIPPVFIGNNCRIQNAIIGPNVSIGDNTCITSSILRESIVGSFAHIEDAILSQSIIGSDATLVGLKQSLNIGDNTQINFTK